MVAAFNKSHFDEQEIRRNAFCLSCYKQSNCTPRCRFTLARTLWISMLYIDEIFVSRL